MNEGNGIFKNITLESQDKGKRFSNKLKEKKDISLLGNKGKGSYGHVLGVKKSNNKKNSVVKLMNEDAKGGEDDMKNEIQFYQSTVNMIYNKIDNKLCNEDRDDLDKNIVKYIQEAEKFIQNKNFNEEEKKRKIKKYVFKKVLETDIPIARPKGLVEKDLHNIGIMLEKGSPLRLCELPKDVQERERIADNFLNGVKKLCDNKIIHGDIKPGNLLLQENGNVKFCDFGGSINLQAIYQDFLVDKLLKIGGTPNYLPTNFDKEVLVNVQNEINYYREREDQSYYEFQEFLVNIRKKFDYYAAIVTYFDIVSGCQGKKYRDKLSCKDAYKSNLWEEVFNALVGNEQWQYQNVEAKNILKLVKFGVRIDVIIKNYVEGKLENEMNENQIINFVKKEMGIECYNNNENNENLVNECVRNTGKWYQSLNHYLKKVKTKLYTGSDKLIESYNVKNFPDKYEAVKLNNSMIKATKNKKKRGDILKADSMLELLDIALHKTRWCAVMDKFIKKVQSNEKLTKMLKDEITKMRNQDQDQETTNLLDYANVIVNKGKFSKQLNEFAEGCAKAAVFNTKQCKSLILKKNHEQSLMLQ